MTGNMMIKGCYVTAMTCPRNIYNDEQKKRKNIQQTAFTNKKRKIYENSHKYGRKESDVEAVMFQPCFVPWKYDNNNAQNIKD